MNPPKAKKPEGANAFFMYICGTQWCEVIESNMSCHSYRIRTWRARTRTWSKNPRWVSGDRITLAGYNVH